MKRGIFFLLLVIWGKNSTTKFRNYHPHHPHKFFEFVRFSLIFIKIIELFHIWTQMHFFRKNGKFTYFSIIRNRNVQMFKIRLKKRNKFLILRIKQQFYKIINNFHISTQNEILFKNGKFAYNSNMVRVNACTQ